MKSKSLRYNYNVLGFSIIVFLCIRQWLSYLFIGMGAQKNLDIWLLCNTGALCVSCLVPTILIERMSGTHPKMFKRVNVVPSLALLGYSYFLITVVSAANSLLLSALRKMGIEFTSVKLQPIDKGSTFILYFVLLCAAPAIVEEIFLRGYVFNLLRPYGRSFAIIVSAMCFAFMHSQVQNIIPIFCCGVLLACIYLLTDSIWVCMLLHFLNNSISFLMMYVTQTMSGVSAFSFVVYLNIFVVLVGIISREYLHKINFRMSSMLKNDQNIEKKVMTLFKSPIAMLALGCFVIMTIGQAYMEIVK
ncbi:MAG: type II CAAX endopeptidase family protein [Oscillospiraceae bacterium]